VGRCTHGSIRAGRTRSWLEPRSLHFSTPAVENSDWVEWERQEPLAERAHTDLDAMVH
jgi:hypothetical protein